MSGQFPPWLKKRITNSEAVNNTRKILKDLELNTVCQQAACPNLCECFAQKQATFMILGNICTRNCGFCAVEKGSPAAVDREEAEKIAQGAKQLGLQHIIITSVTRDDLPDGGADQFVQVIKTLQTEVPQGTIEVLTPDFNGDFSQVAKVVQAKPTVFSHNLETIPELYHKIRPKAQFTKSLAILWAAKEQDAHLLTKTGFMVGLGETKSQVKQLLLDIKAVGCDIVTIGQYLQPTPNNLSVAEFVSPETFAEYERIAKDIGFRHVEAGPFVRSSYQAWNFKTS